MAVGPTVRPPSTPTRTPTPLAKPTATPRPSPTATTTRTPSPTPSPTASPTATATATLPPRQTPAAGEPLPLSLDWHVSANGHLTAGLATSLEGQPAYLLASLGRSVYALGADGEVRWQARTAGPVYALALLDGQRLAAGDDAGIVTLLDGRGQWLWRTDLGSRVTALWAWSDGLLAAGWDERLTFLDDTGQAHWQAGLGGPASAIAALPQLVAAATLSGEVRAFYPDGSEAWRFDAGAPVTGLEARGAGLLAGVQDGRLLALDTNGVLRWQRDLGAGGPLWRALDLAGDETPEIVAGTGSQHPALTLLTSGGAALWRVALPAPVGALASLDLDGDGVVEVLAGLLDGQVLVFDGQGRQRGAVHAGLPVWGLEAAEAGRVLVLADVVAWQMAGSVGQTGGPWLPPPAMLPAPPETPPPGTERAADEAILVFLGDVSPGRSMERQLARYGPAEPWAGLEPLLQEADLAVANLEGVLTTRGRPLDKSYLIRAHPVAGQTLVAAGLDLVTLANNHALDYGQVGLDQTLDTLEGLGITAMGAGRSREQAHRPALFEVRGVRVALLAYAAVRWNGSVDVPATQNIAWAEPATVQAEVRAARNQADVVVVVLHAGTEYAADPSPDQVAVAHAAIDAGADLVVGHHPHVTQTVERYGGGFIVYSLGDALFDIPRPAAMRGHLLRVHVRREGLVQAELWPFWIEGAIQPRLLDDGQGNPRVQFVYP